MSLIHTSHTEKERAARRANALRSTGPRSERGKQQSSSNALKFGWFARSHSSMHRAFGEDPSEAARLRDALVRGLRPSNEAQLMLVEDIAVLRMEKTRNQRAQEAVMLANLENLERQRRRQAIHLEDQRPDTPIAEVHEHGLLRAPDSPGKFEQIQHILKVVLDSLDAHAFFDDAQASFEILWGKHPSMRGQMIMNVHADLLARSRQPGFELVSDAEMLRMAEAEERGQKPEARSQKEEEAGEDDAGPNGVPGGEESDWAEDESVEEEPPLPLVCPYTAGDRSPAAEAERRKWNNTDDLARLRRALLEEQALAFEQYCLYRDEQVEISVAERDACLAPTEQTWRAVYRQEFAIDRQIERKMRLLMEMQKREDRSQESEDRSQEKEESRRRSAVSGQQTRGRSPRPGRGGQEPEERSCQSAVGSRQKEDEGTSGARETGNKKSILSKRSEEVIENKEPLKDGGRELGVKKKW